MKLTLRQLAEACRRVFERDHGPLPCKVCDGTKIVGIYDISDEYGAPCPVCVGVEAYHAKIIRKNFGCLPPELAWPLSGEG